MSAPTVSVVIPCYNAEAFVAEAVASAVAQTVPPVEVVCVDDGSTDDTLGALRRLEAEHPTVRVRTGPNGGPSAARNRGLAEAQGDYIQFLDADDLLAPTKLEHQASLVEAAEGRPDLVAAAYLRTWADGREQRVEVGEDPWTALVEARLGITSSNLWRRESVIDTGGWREGMDISEDPELMFRLLRSGASVLRDHLPLTTLRRRPDSLWHRDHARSWRSWLAIRLDIVRHLKSAGLLTRNRHAAIVSKILEVIERVYDHDTDLASEMYRRAKAELPSGFHKAGRVRAALYRTIGFEATQRVRRVSGRVRQLAS
ncbi:MAG: glycosyltransferase family 2 protein [Bacteroidota bacterium]